MAGFLACGGLGHGTWDRKGDSLPAWDKAWAPSLDQLPSSRHLPLFYLLPALYLPLSACLPAIPCWHAGSQQLRAMLPWFLLTMVGWVGQHHACLSLQHTPSCLLYALLPCAHIHVCCLSAPSFPYPRCETTSFLFSPTKHPYLPTMPLAALFVLHVAACACPTDMAC